MTSNFHLGLPLILDPNNDHAVMDYHWLEHHLIIATQLLNDENEYKSNFGSVGGDFNQDRSPALTQNLLALMGVYGAVRGGAVPEMTTVLFEIGRAALAQQKEIGEVLKNKINILSKIFIKS